MWGCVEAANGDGGVQQAGGGSDEGESVGEGEGDTRPASVGEGTFTWLSITGT